MHPILVLSLQLGTDQPVENTPATSHGSNLPPPNLISPQEPSLQKKIIPSMDNSLRWCQLSPFPTAFCALLDQGIDGVSGRGRNEKRGASPSATSVHQHSDNVRALGLPASQSGRVKISNKPMNGFQVPQSFRHKTQPLTVHGSTKISVLFYLILFVRPYMGTNRECPSSPPPLKLQIHARSSRVIDTAKTLHFAIPAHDSCRLLHLLRSMGRTQYSGAEYSRVEWCMYSGCRIEYWTNNALDKSANHADQPFDSPAYPRLHSVRTPSPLSDLFIRSILRTYGVGITHVQHTSNVNRNSASPDYSIYYSSAQNIGPLSQKPRTL